MLVSLFESLYRLHGREKEDKSAIWKTERKRRVVGYEKMWAISQRGSTRSTSDSISDPVDMETRQNQDKTSALNERAIAFHARLRAFQQPPITERAKSSSVVKTSICHRIKRRAFVVGQKNKKNRHRLSVCVSKKVGRLSPLPAD